MAHKPKRSPERSEIDAAKKPIHDEAPGEARVRGPEERTPGENVLGEDLRAHDELLGDEPRSADDLLSHAESEAVPDRIAEEQQGRQDVELARDEREVYRGRGAVEGHGSGDLADVEDEPGFEALREPEQVPSFGSLDEPDERGPLARDVESEQEPSDDDLREVATGEVDELRAVAGAVDDEGVVDEGIVVPAGRSGSGAARSPDADPELVERAAAWEHVPDLEKASMILERGEGETESLAVSRPGDQAQFDPVSSAAYDEPLTGTMDLRVPGAGITVDRTPRGEDPRDVEPPPDSVREVQRAHDAVGATDDEAARARASARHGRRTKKVKDETKARGAKKATKKKASTPAAERPRRTSRRSTSREQQPGTHEAGAPD